LLFVAIPSFSALVISYRLTAISSNFLIGIQHTRTDAIRRSSRVVICKSADGAVCTGTGGWEQGWLIFSDIDNDGVRDANEEIAIGSPALPAGFRLAGNLNVSDYISYTPHGGAKMTSGAFQSGTLTLCHINEKSGGRQIVINATGRARIQKASANACT